MAALLLGCVTPLSPEPPPTLSPYFTLCHFTLAISRGSGHHQAVPWGREVLWGHHPSTHIPISHTNKHQPTLLH